MQEQDTEKVLAVLSAAFPTHPLGTDTIELWVEVMAPLEADDAMAAARALIRSDEWFPPIARFLEYARQERDRRMRNQGKLDPVPEEPLTEEQRAKHVELVRQMHTLIRPAP